MHQHLQALVGSLKLLLQPRFPFRAHAAWHPGSVPRPHGDEPGGIDIRHRMVNTSVVAERMGMGSLLVDRG